MISDDDDRRPLTEGELEQFRQAEHKAADEFMRRRQPQTDAEERAVRELGEAIGYGRIMQAAEKLWRKSNEAQGTAGSELAVGPCAAALVPCPHCDVGLDEGESCAWCCGAGRVTRRVAKAIRDVGR